jgi:hypothetical protein
VDAFAERGDGRVLGELGGRLAASPSAEPGAAPTVIRAARAQIFPARVDRSASREGHMARPYGDEGRWGERWRERDEHGGEERFGQRHEYRPGSEHRGEQGERRYGGEEGWQGEYGREPGAHERGGWEERESQGRPYGYGYGSGGPGERDEGRWYGGAWEHEQEGGRERGRMGEHRTWGEPERWPRTDMSAGGRRWPGGVRGAEAGQPYGRGLFGTAYALYAGRMEPGERERARTGRGPKGYRRSDERIHDDVCERIARAGIDADEVEVKVVNGEVTLSGSVHRRDEKHWLEDVAEDVFGVQEVHNHLRVLRGEQGTTPGQERQAQTFGPRH